MRNQFCFLSESKRSEFHQEKKFNKVSSSTNEQQMRLRLLKAEADRAELDLVLIGEKITNIRLRNRMLHLDLEEKEKNNRKHVQTTMAYDILNSSISLAPQIEPHDSAITSIEDALSRSDK